MSAPPASLYHVKCGTREMRLNQVQNHPIHLLDLIARGAERGDFLAGARKKRLFCEVRPVTKAPQAENFRADPPRIS